MITICYNTFERFSLSSIRLTEIFKNVIQKNKDALINTDSNEIYQTIVKFFPDYCMYKNKNDSRYTQLLTTLLQKKSELFFCPSFEEIDFLGSIDHKIQFCFTDKINVIVNDNIVTIIPKYIFEIRIDIMNLRSPRLPKLLETEELVNVSYKVYKLNNTDNFMNIEMKNKLNFNKDEKLFKANEQTFESNIIEYEEVYNLNSENEMYDKINLIMIEGCLPIKHNRVICDIFEEFFSIDEYRVNIYDFPFSDIVRFLNDQYKKSLIDTYYNCRNSVLPFILNKRTKDLSSTLSRIDKTTIYNLAKKQLYQE